MTNPVFSSILNSTTKAVSGNKTDFYGKDISMSSDSNNTRLFQASKIVTTLIHEHNLQETSALRDSLRKEVERFCQSIDIWQGEEKTNLWTKSKCIKVNAVSGLQRTYHYFTADERQQILDSKEINEYIVKHYYSSAAIEAYCEAEKEAEKRNSEYEEYLSGLDFEELLKQEDSGYYGVSLEEVRQKKFEMMIEAIFTKTFGGKFDTAKLMDDMETSHLEDGRDHTAKSVLAEKRLADIKNYIIEEK